MFDFCFMIDFCNVFLFTYYISLLQQVLFYSKRHLRDTKIHDTNGISMPAVTFVSMSRGYLREIFLRSLTKTSTVVYETDVRYAITIPGFSNGHANESSWSKGKCDKYFFFLCNKLTNH